MKKREKKATPKCVLFKISILFMPIGCDLDPNLSLKVRENVNWEKMNFQRTGIETKLRVGLYDMLQF